ncbi:uncharacterized protein METZ01_LOCUS153787, partial [marine metagenome]
VHDGVLLGVADEGVFSFAVVESFLSVRDATR